MDHHVEPSRVQEALRTLTSRELQPSLLFLHQLNQLFSLEFRSELATGLQNREKYSLHEFTVSHYGDGLRHYFPCRPIAECYKSLGIETHKQLADLVSTMSGDVTESWLRLLEVENEIKDALVALEADIKGAEGLTEIVSVGGQLPADIPLLEVKTNKSTSLGPVLVTSPLTLLVLVRHFG